jgi:hypothetical protein
MVFEFMKLRNVEGDAVYHGAHVCNGRVHVVRLRLFGLLYQPPVTDCDEYGAVGGKSGRGNPSIRR